MTLSEKSMAAVLLCTYIGIPDDSEIKPFTPGEWEKLETIIGQKGLKIENVIVIKIFFCKIFFIFYTF